MPYGPQGGGGAGSGSNGSLANIAALRALLTITPNAYFVLGYYAPGDGGGGEYFYDAADVVSPDNGGTVIVDAAGHRWKLSSPYPISVKQFGATGLGVVNDAPFINAAIAAVKLPYLPAGIYNVSTPLALSTTGSGLIGAGRGATTIRATTANQPVITLALGIADYELRNFSLTRNVAATSNGHGISQLGIIGTSIIDNIDVELQFIGLSLAETGFSKVSNTLVQKCNSHGILLSSGATGQLQWTLENVLSAQNVGAGCFVSVPGAATSVSLGEYINLSTFANTSFGLAVVGAPGKALHGLRIDGGFYGQDGNTEIFIDSYGATHSVSDAYVELAGAGATGPTLATPASHIGRGIQITANNDATKINNCNVIGNSLNGIDNSGINTVVQGGQSMNNGQAVLAGERSGLFNRANSCAVSGAFQTGNISGNVSQQYGVYSVTDDILCVANVFLDNTVLGFDQLVPIVNSVVANNISR